MALLIALILTTALFSLSSVRSPERTQNEALSTTVVKEVREHVYKSENDIDFDPPEWIRDYIQFHNNHAKRGRLVETTTKYLQYECLHTGLRRENRCGGLGDRIKGIIMGMLFSIIDDRVFLVNWDDWTSLSDYLVPAHIDWLAQPRQNTNTTVENFWVPSDKYHPYMETPCLWRSNATGVKYRSAVLKAVKKMNQTCVKEIFQGKEVDELMWHTIFWILFRFTDRVKSTAHRILGTINPKYYVGVHIRAGGNGTSFIDPERFASLEEWQLFSDCTKLVRSELKRKCRSQPSVYVASDNEHAKQFMKGHGSDVHAAQVEIYHIDRSDMTLVHNLTSATDAVWAEFKVLMDATCLVVGRSGFSLLASHMARRQPKCAVRFDRCGLDFVQKAVDENARC